MHYHKGAGHNKTPALCFCKLHEFMYSVSDK